VKNLKIKLVHFLGWLLFIISLCVVIAGVIANTGEKLEFGIIGFFVVLGAFGFFLTRYKKEKKVGISENKVQKKSLAEKLQEQKEKTIQKQKKLKEQTEALKKQYRGNKEYQANIGSQENPPITKQDESTPSNEEAPEDRAYRETIENYKAENSIFHIEYTDYAGKESSRDIEIMGFQEDNGKLYINAYCHLAKDRRQFLVDRIESISFEGNTIQNPKDFFWDRYKNSTIYKTQEVLNTHIDEILALVFLAKSDGKMLRNEREVIARYIDIIVPGIDSEAVEKMLKNTTCELTQFNGILKRAKLWELDTKKLVMDAASQIIALKKQLDPMEKATFEKLAAVIE